MLAPPCCIPREQASTTLHMASTDIGVDTVSALEDEANGETPCKEL